MKLVLLPGLDGTGLLFTPLLAALPQHIDVTIINYPCSEKQNYSELVDYVLPQLPQEDYVLVGESFSGSVAYRIAIRESKYLKKIVFVASFLSNPRPLLLRIINFLPSKMIFLIPPPQIIVKHFLLGNSADYQAIKSFLDVLKVVSPDVLSFRLKEIGRLKISTKSPDIKAYYIQATRDYLVTKESLKEFDQLFSDMKLFRVEGPHFILQSNPEECAMIIANVLNTPPV